MKRVIDGDTIWRSIGKPAERPAAEGREPVEKGGAPVRDLRMS
jgi:hypothetical protein